jgi:hypothetical protein
VLGVVTAVLKRIGRVLQPLLDPDAAERQARAAATAKALEQAQAALGRIAEQVEKVTERLDKVDRRQIDHLEQALSVLQFNTRRQSAFAERLLRAAHHDSEHEFVRERALRRIHQLSKRDAPILVGPWTGEVGFELLYWAPFVRWALRKFSVDPARVTLLSRGGTKDWYGIGDARYLDVFDLCRPDEFRTRTAEAKKQRTLRLFDRDLIRRAWRTMGSRSGALHPAMMYALYMPYWKQQTSSRWIDQFAEHLRITPPVIPELRLPAEYVAVRFYFSECFPDTPQNREVVDALIRSLAAETHVVLLTPRVRVDDHHDFEAIRSERVHTVDHLMRPGNNLAVQTAVIAGARAFVGTYGGFSYLAPLCGVNAVALYSRRTYFAYHLDFAQQVFDAIQGGSLTVIDAATWPLMRHVGAAAAQPTGEGR